MDYAYAVSVFIAIFAIVNPIGNIPFFYNVNSGLFKRGEEKSSYQSRNCSYGHIS